MNSVRMASGHPRNVEWRGKFPSQTGGLQRHFVSIELRQGFMQECDSIQVTPIGSLKLRIQSQTNMVSLARFELFNVHS